MKQIIKPVLRYYGSKHKSFNQIAPFIPKHQVYVEPFGGSASVLLNKHPSRLEVYNDLDIDLYRLFRVLGAHPLSYRLQQEVKATDWNKKNWEQAFDESSDLLTSSLNTLIRSWMSFSPMGTTYGRTGYRTGLYVASNQSSHSSSQTNHTTGHPAIWEKLPERIALVTKRLNQTPAPIVALNSDGLSVLDEYDDPNTLFYIDPPYVHSTRGSESGYRHEMELEQHAELLDRLSSVKGAVMLSGYPSALYKLLLKDWTVHEFSACASGRAGGMLRTECLWLNQRCLQLQAQTSLFALPG